MVISYLGHHKAITIEHVDHMKTNQIIDDSIIRKESYTYDKK